MPNTVVLDPKTRSINVFVLLFGAFIAATNQMILSPALPSIMRSLSIDAALGQWLTTIFLLVSGIMVPCTAYMTKRFTTRSLYMWAMSVFTIGTLVCGFAPAFFILLFGRMLQALGLGVLMPLVTNVLLITYPIQERGKAMGYFGIIMAAAPAVGPSLAGYVVDNFGWNEVFLCLVPFCIINMVAAYFLVVDVFPSGEAHLDIKSVILSTLGFGGLLLGFSLVGTRGWLDYITLGSFIVAFFALRVFIRRQLADPEPFLNLRIFSNKQFRDGTIIGMIVNGALVVGGIVTPIYLQNVLGYSALKTAILMLPSAILMTGLSIITGYIYDKYGPRVISLIGLFILSSGTFLYTTFNETSGFWYLMIIYTYRILGIGLTMTPINTWAVHDLSTDQIPHGNAAGNTMRQVAGSVGTALIISVMLIVSRQYAHLGVDHSTVIGMHVAFGIAGALMTVALVMAFVVVKEKNIIDGRKCEEGNEPCETVDS